MNRSEVKGCIIDIFEDFLAEKEVSIENSEREGDNPAIIYGSDYDAIGDRLDRLFDALTDEYITSNDAWYVESWFDGDIEEALQILDIPYTEENLRKAKRILRGIFDDKSDRNEMIVQVLGSEF